MTTAQELHTTGALTPQPISSLPRSATRHGYDGNQGDSVHVIIITRNQDDYCKSNPIVDDDAGQVLGLPGKIMKPQRLRKKEVCKITGLPAKYRDPKYVHLESESLLKSNYIHQLAERLIWPLSKTSLFNNASSLDLIDWEGLVFLSQTSSHLQSWGNEIKWENRKSLEPSISGEIQWDVGLRELKWQGEYRSCTNNCIVLLFVFKSAGRLALCSSLLLVTFLEGTLTRKESIKHLEKQRITYPSSSLSLCILFLPHTTIYFQSKTLAYQNSQLPYMACTNILLSCLLTVLWATVYLSLSHTHTHTYIKKHSVSLSSKPSTPTDLCNSNLIYKGTYQSF